MRLSFQRETQPVTGGVLIWSFRFALNWKLELELFQEIRCAAWLLPLRPTGGSHHTGRVRPWLFALLQLMKDNKNSEAKCCSYFYSQFGQIKLSILTFTAHQHLATKGKESKCPPMPAVHRQPKLGFWKISISTTNFTA